MFRWWTSAYYNARGWKLCRADKSSARKYRNEKQTRLSSSFVRSMAIWLWAKRAHITRFWVVVNKYETGMPWWRLSERRRKVRRSWKSNISTYCADIYKTAMWRARTTMQLLVGRILILCSIYYNGIDVPSGLYIVHCLRYNNMMGNAIPYVHSYACVARTCMRQRFFWRKKKEETFQTRVAKNE